VSAGDASGRGALWLRVDRPNQHIGFFDNMEDRPIRESEWRQYSVEGQVAADAARIAFGAMAAGAATADFDSVALETHGADGTWSAVPLAGWAGPLYKQRRVKPLGPLGRARAIRRSAGFAEARPTTPFQFPDSRLLVY
jgi:hypothetical protein